MESKSDGMIRSCIDIGSNSVLLLSVQWDEQITKELLNCSHITSLGKDLDKNKFFDSQSMQATYEALLDYKMQLEKINVSVSDVIVTATEAARVATNAKEFFERIKSEIGFRVQIISSEKEAYLTALGVVSGIKSQESTLVVMDIGGASTELIRIENSPFKIISSVSLAVGSVRATDWKNSNQFDDKMSEILSKPLNNYQADTMICVAGSMTSLATMLLEKTHFNDREIDGIQIEMEKFKTFALSLQNTSATELLTQFPFLGKRAPMVAAGANVALLILELLKVKKIQVSTRGLRYGVVFQGHI
jgi:exopolyphosphatase/guanosine-5'-triphosphate,3'-diphosphate pyrophosphatase